VLEQTAKLLLALELPLTSKNYTKEEEQWAKDEKGIKEKGGLVELPDQRLFVPSAVAALLLKQHELAHLGITTLEKLLDEYYFSPKLPTLCAQISARCITCAQNNVSQGPKPSPGIQTTGNMQFEDLEVDFTEVNCEEVALSMIPVPLGPCLHLLRVG
jgi:hypothetical protein